MFKTYTNKLNTLQHLYLLVVTLTKNNAINKYVTFLDFLLSLHALCCEHKHRKILLLTIIHIVLEKKMLALIEMALV